MQPDQGPLDNRHRAIRVAVGVLFRMQPVPGGHLDPAVDVIGGVKADVR